MLDPIWRLAGERSLQRRVTDWLDLQIQLQSHDGWFISMFIMARDEATDALSALAIVDAEDHKEIRKLQNQVAKFDDLVRWVRKIMSDGKEANQLLGLATRQDVQQYIDEEGRFEAEELGLVSEEPNDA